MPAPSLVGQILQEQRIHRALEANMQMRHFAFRQGEHLHVSIGHALENARDVFLVAGEAVHRLG
ncbi:hypothetical protein AB433_00650 [Croceicoccus naphthovorans]|uniref:Uncharacterized protein n=1 Tax=Croceicoccus naphthovorans TaxID=1348774 RepID=A0A0G3XCB4_9SPHN|nr:hypothetical protein AB433_00650 [Croceicoccus naphthovorans]